MQIKFEKEILEWLDLPAIPRKAWDSEKRPSFKHGVAVIRHTDGMESYAVATFDADKDAEPRIKKVFELVPYKEVLEIYVVPSYMDEDVDSMDLDDESKRKVERILQEVQEMENEGVEEEKPLSMDDLPEWIFPEIHNAEEGQAWLRRYNKMHGIKKGKVPTNAETIKLRLFSIYSEQQKKRR